MFMVTENSFFLPGQAMEMSHNLKEKNETRMIGPDQDFLHLWPRNVFCVTRFL
jgi:hypothetical protein